MLPLLHTAFTWSSVIAGLASAALWLPGYDGQGKKADPDATLEAPKARAQLQSQYNRYAAFVTVTVTME